MTELNVYNIHNIPPKKRKAVGTTAEAAINRLRSASYEIDRSTGEIIGIKNERLRQLYDDVLEGRKKPNAAAIEAGFRPPKVAVRLDNMRSTASTLAQQRSIVQCAMREHLPIGQAIATLQFSQKQP